jgi:hypothetical protein
MSEMQEKIAQRMSAWQHIKETGNLPRKWREWTSKDIYGGHMDALRRVDDTMRERMKAGWPTLEQAVRESRRSFKRGDYPSALFYANQVSQFAGQVLEDVQEIIDLRDEEIQEFYFNNPEAVVQGDLATMHEQLTGKEKPEGEKPKPKKKPEKKPEKKPDKPVAGPRPPDWETTSGLHWAKEPSAKTPPTPFAPKPKPAKERAGFKPSGKPPTIPPSKPSTRMGKKESLELSQLMVEARIGGPLSSVREFGWDVANIFSKRQRELGLLEKIYRNKMLEQKKAARELAGKSKALAQYLERTLEQMGDHRASGDISSYIAAAQKLREYQEKFNDRLTELYQAHFAEIIGQMVGAEEEPAAAAAAAAAEEGAAEPPQPVAPQPPAPVAPEIPEPPTGPKPHVEPVPPPGVAAPEEAAEETAEEAAEKTGSVQHLWQQIKVAYENDDKPVAGALLARYSQVCEDKGHLRSSVAALSLARELLDE